MQLQMNRLKPGGDEVDILTVAIAATKFIERIFKIDILSIDLVGLILREALVILAENIKKRHQGASGENEKEI
jgi:hypothetical protein